MEIFLTYLKSDESTGENIFVTYNLVSGEKQETEQVNGENISYGELVNGKPAFILLKGNIPDTNLATHFSFSFYYDGETTANISGFKYFDGDFYFILPDSVGITILKNNLSIGHFDDKFEGSENMMSVYPDCTSFDSEVCLYDKNNYAVQSALIGIGSAVNPYYINGTKIDPSNIYTVEPLSSNFIFTSNGDTYVVYSEFNQILGQDITANTPPVVLFKLDKSISVGNLKVVPQFKSITNN